jgi:putative inorganic carbon (HCO3(-)) transporter
MGYFVLLLTIMVYLIRPAEWIPGLGFNWNMLLNGLGILIIFAKSLDKDSSANTDRTTLYLVWFVLAVFVSSLTNFLPSTISIYFSQLISIIITFMLVQATINTPKEINRLILVFIITLLFICFQCYLQVNNGVNWGGLEPYSRGVLSSRSEETGIAQIREFQVIWFGVFGDPNDLGMLLIAFLPFLVNKSFLQPTPKLKKLFWISTLFIIAYTIFLTNSRGTMVALILGISSFVIIKKKSVKALFTIAFFVMLVVLVGPSRLAEITSGDTSSMGRIYAWIEALYLFRMNPIFGIGAMQFLEYHFITTHNSFVLALAETGLLGFTAYLGIFIITVSTAIKVAYAEKDEIRKMEIIALTSGLIGIMAAIFFISRTYVLLPFLYIAILITYIRVHCPEHYKKYINEPSLLKLIASAMGFVVFIYLFNRMSTNVLL